MCLHTRYDNEFDKIDGISSLFLFQQYFKLNRGRVVERRAYLPMRGSTSASTSAPFSTILQVFNFCVVGLQLTSTAISPCSDAVEGDMGDGDGVPGHCRRAHPVVELVPLHRPQPGERPHHGTPAQGTTHTHTVSLSFSHTRTQSLFLCLSHTRWSQLQTTKAFECFKFATQSKTCVGIQQVTCNEYDINDIAAMSVKSLRDYRAVDHAATRKKNLSRDSIDLIRIETEDEQRSSHIYTRVENQQNRGTYVSLSLSLSLSLSCLSLSLVSLSLLCLSLSCLSLSLVSLVSLSRISLSRVSLSRVSSFLCPSRAAAGEPAARLHDRRVRALRLRDHQHSVRLLP